MLIALLVVLVLLLLGLVVFFNRDLLLCVGRWILHQRYRVTPSGLDDLDPTRTYLIVPNHPAIVDPLVLTAELYHRRVVIRPLVDESFFSNTIFRHIFKMFNAVKVPDFRKLNFRPVLKRRPSLKDSAHRARQLHPTVVETLAKGGSVLVYPSGHITANGREELSNRQLVYNVISKLPKGVSVLGVRIRGLYGSMWSRVGGRAAPRFALTFVKAIFLWFGTWFRRRRAVTIHFEDLTERVAEWAKDGRQAFNAALERWYDADLRALGLEYEIAT